MILITAFGDFMQYDGPVHERITKKLRKIAQLYNIKLRFVPYMFCSGEYDGTTNTATVRLDNPARFVISTFFHELSHYLDHKAGLFKSFYSTQSPLYKIRRLALRAELHTDDRAKVLCKQYFPHIRYRKSYRNQSDRLWLKEYYRDGRCKKTK